jgi:hypothetical protein
MGELSNFQKGPIVGARLSVASVNRTATLVGIYRTAVSQVMTAYTNLEKT